MSFLKFPPCYLKYYSVSLLTVYPLRCPRIWQTCLSPPSSHCHRPPFCMLSLRLSIFWVILRQFLYLPDLCRPLFWAVCCHSLSRWDLQTLPEVCLVWLCHSLCPLPFDVAGILFSTGNNSLLGARWEENIFYGLSHPVILSVSFVLFLPKCSTSPLVCLDNRHFTSGFGVD